ncbi:unnamed protein product [Parajaminaea phylloscopi]
MADDEAVPSFDDASQEAEYWRSKANALKTMLQEAEDGLRDFAESSKELEIEMERELAQSAKDLDDVRTRNEKLGHDKEEWKSKYQNSLLEHNKTLAEMSRELSQLRESHNIYKDKLRDMELDNDELENAERMVRSSLNDIEQRYNQQMERATLMEEELITKNQLEEENQRLRDEIRELHEEVAVMRERDSLASVGPSRGPTPAESSSASGRHEGELSLTDLTSKTPTTTSSSPTRPESSLSVSRVSPGKPRPSHLPSANRTPLVPRRSLAAHAHRGSRDLSRTITGEDRASPSTGLYRGAVSSRSRVADLASSRAAGSMRTPRTGVRSAAGTTSRKMMRDLLGNMSALQDRLHKATSFGPTPAAHSDPDRSALPRPSSRMSSSVAGTPLSRPRPSFDGKSSIPVASSGLNRSIRRPSSRASVGPVRASVLNAADNDSPPGVSYGSNAARSMTPTMYTARARAHPQISTASGLSRGPASAVTSGATSPLDFLNTEPEARPGSRNTFAARDSLAKSRRTSAAVRMAHSRNHSTSAEMMEGSDPAFSSSSATAGSGSSGLGRPRGSTVTAFMPMRRSVAPSASSASSSSSSRSALPADPRPATAGTSSSSVAAFREARLNQQPASTRPSSSQGRPSHRPLSGLSTAGGPPPPSWKKRNDPLLQSIGPNTGLRRSRSSSVGSEH